MKRPPKIWRCPCGAMLASEKARDRHLNGQTMCQHGEVAEYVFNGWRFFRDDEPSKS